jgi:hypothetical protein
VRHKENLNTYYPFYGKYYTYLPNKKELRLGSIWSDIKSKLEELYERHGWTVYSVLKAYLQQRRDYSWWSRCDYNTLLYQAEMIYGSSKGLRKALDGLKTYGIFDTHKGEVSTQLELLPLLEEIVEDWSKRPRPIMEKKIRIDRHKTLLDFVAAYPSEAFGEPLDLVEKNYQLSSGDKIDLIFRDVRGNLLIVEIKPQYEEKTVSQLVRYKEEYSTQNQIDKQRIRLAVVCGGEIDAKFRGALRDEGVEMYRLQISGLKLE